MAGMKWYKVWLVVPGTDGDAENGPCEPEWWNGMEQAPDGETAVRQANEKARRLKWYTKTGHGGVEIRQGKG